jgi:hypothetical protein
MGGIIHCLSMLYLAMIEKSKVTDQANWNDADRKEHLAQIWFFFLILGLGLSIKIAIFP